MTSEPTIALALVMTVAVVAMLAIRVRRHRSLALGYEGDIARIHAIAELVAEGEPAEFVVIAVARELRELLHLRDVRFQLGLRPPDERAIARIEQSGHVRVGQVAWGADSMGLPQEAELPVQSGGQVWGRYLLVATPGFPVSFERRIVAVALAAQAGAALATMEAPSAS